METPNVHSAVRAATAVAGELGLPVEDAAVIYASNRFAVRLLPCDTLARVAPPKLYAGSTIEHDIARRLAAIGSPVAAPDPRVQPRVYERDGFAVTFWTYYAPVAPMDAAPAEYAQALERLHAGLRDIDLPAPHFSDRAAAAQRIVDDPSLSPELPEADRELLSSTLRELSAFIAQRGAAEQLIHGEPHPGNVLRTANGLLFTDFETCRRGPVEFDIAWYARVGPESWDNAAEGPDEVGRRYPGTDRELIRACWMLMLAIVAAHRWDRNDRVPDRRIRGEEWLGFVRAAVERYGV